MGTKTEGDAAPGRGRATPPPHPTPSPERSPEKGDTGLTKNRVRGKEARARHGPNVGGEQGCGPGEAPGAGVLPGGPRGDAPGRQRGSYRESASVQTQLSAQATRLTGRSFTCMLSPRGSEAVALALGAAAGPAGLRPEHGVHGPLHAPTPLALSTGPLAAGLRAARSCCPPGERGGPM